MYNDSSIYHLIPRPKQQSIFLGAAMPWYVYWKWPDNWSENYASRRAWLKSQCRGCAVRKPTLLGTSLGLNSFHSWKKMDTGWKSRKMPTQKNICFIVCHATFTYYWFIVCLCLRSQMVDSWDSLLLMEHSLGVFYPSVIGRLKQCKQTMDHQWVYFRIHWYHKSLNDFTNISSGLTLLLEFLELI